MRADPPVRRDSCCRVCGKRRKMPKGQLYRTAAERDPFCSNTCARKWHHAPLPERSIWRLDPVTRGPP